MLETLTEKHCYDMELSELEQISLVLNNIALFLSCYHACTALPISMPCFLMPSKTLWNAFLPKNKKAHFVGDFIIDLLVDKDSN